MSGIGIFYEPEAYSIDTDLLMGRHAAGAGFMRAYAATRPERGWCFSRAEAARADMARLLSLHGSPATQIDWVGLQNLSALETPGLLYRPDPAITEDAWRRLGHARPEAWSLCGITHTTAHHSVTAMLAGMLIAPLERWDALICTSESVRGSVLSILEAQADYLVERLGARQATLPQLPVIPLGIHTADFGVDDRERAAARAEFDLAPDDIVFLFVGRLSAYSKAHPVPMFLALEACATAPDTAGPGGRITLIQAGWFETEAARAEFEADARSLCPSVRCLTVDGRDPKARRQAWASADIFTSLADSVQETFGLTPLEAMASGLPVVVSDWNGYKDSVRDGIDGFRIPTTAMPAGTGQALADRYALGLDDYHGYIGIVGQFVAVDVEAASTAYRRLARDPALRRRMGAAGRARVRTEFEWSVIFGRYEDLWSELGKIRSAADRVLSTLSPRHHPDRPDPFTMFAGYPTCSLMPDTAVRRAAGATLALALQRRGLATVRFADVFLPGPDLMEAVLSGLPAEDPMSFDALRLGLGRSPLALAPAVIWLAKMGLLILSNDIPPGAVTGRCDEPGHHG